jgi:hypothetical protein
MRAAQHFIQIIGKFRRRSDAARHERRRIRYVLAT